MILANIGRNLAFVPCARVRKEMTAAAWGEFCRAVAPSLDQRRRPAFRGRNGADTQRPAKRAFCAWVRSFERAGTVRLARGDRPPSRRLALVTSAGLSDPDSLGRRRSHSSAAWA